MSNTQKPRTGGPVKCPHPCSECPEGDHHFSDAMLDDEHSAEEGAEHPAAKQGVEVWYQCKHCDAWREFGEDDEEDTDEEDED